MARSKLTTLAYALLASTPLLAAGSMAFAQRQTTYDPAQLPEVKGKVAQYLVNPRGDVDGLMLADGTEIHIPPFASTEVAVTVKPGDAVTIHGLKARAVPMVAAASIQNDATGTLVTIAPPHAHGGMGSPMELTGKIKAQLHEPRGGVNGVLLEDGGIVRLPPPEAQRLAAQLTPGATLMAKGDGYTGPLGRVVAAREIGPDAAHLTKVAAPPHGEHGMMGAMRDRMHGMMHPHPADAPKP
jgi:hypothetical protein